jgi:hypothetical protein
VLRRFDSSPEAATSAAQPTHGALAAAPPAHTPKRKLSEGGGEGTVGATASKRARGATPGTAGPPAGGGVTPAANGDAAGAAAADNRPAAGADVSLDAMFRLGEHNKVRWLRPWPPALQMFSPPVKAWPGMCVGALKACALALPALPCFSHICHPRYETPPTTHPPSRRRSWCASWTLSGPGTSRRSGGCARRQRPHAAMRRRPGPRPRTRQGAAAACMAALQHGRAPDAGAAAGRAHRHVAPLLAAVGQRACPAIAHTIVRNVVFCRSAPPRRGRGRWRLS